jgi:hypothetical protein
LAEILTRLGSAALAFGLAPALWFGSAALLADPNARGAVKGGAVGTAVGISAFWIAPFLGYGFIVRSFQPWSDHDRATRASFIALSAFYWLAYMPLLYWFWASIAVGWAGGV